jgi:uncharacterized membrane protein YbhN (UPF0104 family)
MAGVVLYALLPVDDGVGFGRVLGVFLIAQIAGLLSHIPGGLGVFESLVLALLRDRLPAADLLGALLAYRAIYYLLPLALALALAVIVLGLYDRSPLSGTVRRWWPSPISGRVVAKNCRWI